MRHYDVVIIGGGPAGSTVATLVKRYASHLRVLILEKAHFPRHHIGESMLTGSSPVLAEMGVYDKIKQYGFVEKLGANYIWGQSRAVWGFTFDEMLATLAEQGKALPELYTKTWQVRRAEYDQILLQHAAETGADVCEGARVSRILRRSDGRVTGAEYIDAQGTHQVASTWLMDCSGQDGLIGRELKLRELDDQMNNYALFGYWKGAAWKFEYAGHPDKTRIFIVTTPRGWIWYIPVSREVISVGFVTHRRTLKQLENGPEQLYREEIASCPEIQDLLANAQLTRISSDQAHDVCAIQDWSYMNRQVAGDGWAMVGDAAGFVDPILSSGTMLAHELGQKAAYTLISSFESHDDEQIKRYWAFYDETYHTYLQAYRDMARFWYRNNFSMESWWWQAQRTLAQSGGQVDLRDRDAFNRIAFGYATRAESLSLFGSFPIHEARQLVDALFGVGRETSALGNTYADRPLKLKEGVQITEGMYYYQGRVRTTRRVTNSNGRYLDLHPAEELVLKVLDGKHTLDDLDQAVAALQRLDSPMPVRRGLDLLVQLDNIGALATT